MTAEHAIIQSRIDMENAARQALDALESPKLDVSFDRYGAVLRVVCRGGIERRLFTGTAEGALGVVRSVCNILSAAPEMEGIFTMAASSDLCVELLSIRVETDEAS